MTRYVGRISARPLTRNSSVRSRSNAFLLGARLWFELVNNRGPGTFDAQPEAFRRMWLDNFNARRPAAPPLAGCIAGSCSIVIPSVTHFMSYQEPEVFNEAVLGFLSHH